MLSEEYIENLTQPIIDRQISINNYVVNKIAARVNEIGHMLPSDIHMLQQLMKSGADVRQINKELARLTGLQEEDIKRLIKKIAAKSYQQAKPFYDYRQKPYIPFNENIQLQRVVNAVQKITIESYRNLSNSTAFMIRDRRFTSGLRPTPLSKVYTDVVDEAIQAVQSGVIDFNTAMRRTMQQLIDSGIRYVTYSPESGRRYTKRLDSAVRQNILDAVRDISQQCQDEIGRQTGADGKEITAHPCPAPDHQFVQGHQFTNEQFELMQEGESCRDLQGRQYAGFERSIGQWNCRHVAWSIICGLSQPVYSDKQLNKILKDNEKGYTLPDGRHLTGYECTQYQRQLETKIRHGKDGQIAALEAGDRQLAEKYQAKVNKYTKEYNAFSKAAKVQPMPQKMRVSGYRKIKVS